MPPRADPTLKELSAPDLTQQPLSISFPSLGEGVTLELKSGFLHHLPEFHGMSLEDPNRHLSEFHAICSSMQPAGVTVDQLKLRSFPFTLKGEAKDWLYYLPPNSITSWGDMKKAFLEKFFPANRSSQLKKEIRNVEQASEESLYEYWERFKRLCTSCPYHGYDDGDLILYFYNGLNNDDLRMVDSCSGGGFMNKTAAAAKAFITELAENSRTYGTRRRGNGSSAEVFSLQNQVSELTSLMKGLLVQNKPQMHQVKACTICSSPEHVTDSCPTLQERSLEEVNVAGFVGQQRRYDPYSSTCNQGWRDRPNLQYGNQEGAQQFPQHPQGQPPSSSPSTEDMLHVLTTNVTTMQQNMVQFQQETKSSIQNLESQVGHISNAVSRLEAQNSRKVPSQTLPNPSANVIAMTLRCGRELPEPIFKKAPKKVVNDCVRGDDVIDDIDSPHEQVDASEPSLFPPAPVEGGPVPRVFPTYVPEPPFPEALKKSRRFENDSEMFETFRKCEVNIPLFDLIKSVPRYAKFLKELCTVKRKQKLKAAKKVKVSEHVSAIIQRKLPPKCTDPGMFTIPCTIRDTKFDTAMLDLGASINVLPHSLCETLGLGPLHDTSVVIQLADRSLVRPKGVVRDMLVGVDKLVFPADFYVLDMDCNSQAPSILLGRPFMKTARTKIDVYSGSLTLEFDGVVVGFTMQDSMTQSRDDTVNSIDVSLPLGVGKAIPCLPIGGLIGLIESGRKSLKWRVKKKDSSCGFRDVEIGIG